MGADSSVELKKPFFDISKWPKSRVESVVKSYFEGEYDFGIDANIVSNITGLELNDAKDLVTVHSKNESGIINAVTLLATIITLGNSENRNEIHRAESVFELIDFNKNGRVSFDELTILLLCIGSSFAFMIEGKLSDEKQQTNETAIMHYVKSIYDSLKKKPNTSISKEEFVRWARDQLFGNGIFHVNDIYSLMIQPPEAQETNGSPHK